MISQRKVVCLLALTLLVGLVALSGCIGGNKPASTEPIVGIWVWTSSVDNTIYTDTFVSDGTYVVTSSDSSISTKTGTWSKIQTNEYLVKRSDGETYTWIYHPTTDTITQPEYPNVPSYRQGVKPVTTKSIATTPTVARAQAPIIGVWRYYSTTMDDRYRFNADGTYVESYYGPDMQSPNFHYGTWVAQSGNSYVTTEKIGTTTYSDTFVYSPSQKNIYNTKYPSLLLTPYEGDVMTTVSFVPESPTVTQSQDPIIGVWNNPGSPVFRIKFSADGTSQETSSSRSGVFSGTWRVQGNNKYLVTRTGGAKSTWTYVPSSKTVYEDDYSGLIYYPYQGSVYFT
jgi:hypothetical protein